MKEQPISFDTAKLAKEKGFEEGKAEYWLQDNTTISVIDDEYELKCLRVKDQNPDMVYQCKAPTQSLLQKWLREKHGVEVNAFNLIHFSYCYQYYETGKSPESGKSKANFNKHEDALEEGLQEALKLIQNIDPL